MPRPRMSDLSAISPRRCDDGVVRHGGGQRVRSYNGAPHRIERVVTRIVVLGDSTLDVDVTGVVARLSPEAPVPVIADSVEARRPGGAALAALLAAQALGAPGDEVVLITGLGADAPSAELRAMLAGRVSLIGVASTGTLAVKTRWRTEGHAIARLDTGGETGTLGRLPESAAEAIAGAAAVLVCDYGRGMAADPAVRAAVADTTAPVVWDPHPRGPAPVPGVRLVTPNLLETAAALPHAAPGRDVATAARNAAALVEAWKVSGVAVTLGEAGALLSAGDGAPLLVPASRMAAGDTCGAGDAFAAAATVALGRGALSSEAVQAGVIAAGAFVAAGGAARWPLAAGSARWPVAADAGALPGLDAVEAAARVRAAGGTVVATGGCFDLLHAGHVSLLEAARSLGDLLVVLLNSDSSVRRLKGPDRPLQPEADRTQVLAGLRCVDHVLCFDEDTPAAALASICPHLWVKGGDYTGGTLPEAAQLAGWGAQAVTVPFLAGRSTSRLVSAARAAEPDARAAEPAAARPRTAGLR